MTALRCLAALTFLSLTLAAPGAFASCVCPRVEPEEIVRHATTIALVRVTRAAIVPEGVDVAGTIDYVRGSGPDRFEKRITSTDPYFCGFTLRAGDELLDTDAVAPSLGAMTCICVLYDTLRNRARIDQYVAIAKQQR
jgi:hypothetical protein